MLPVSSGVKIFRRAEGAGEGEEASVALCKGRSVTSAQMKTPSQPYCYAFIVVGKDSLAKWTLMFIASTCFRFRCDLFKSRGRVRGDYLPNTARKYRATSGNT